MRRRTQRALASSLALVACGATLTACFEEPSPHEAVRGFLVGWQTGDYESAARRTDGDPAKVARAIEDVGVHLDAASFRFRIMGLRHTGGASEADFKAEVDLGENNPLWEYDGKLPLHLVDGHWKVRWSPSVLHPQLKEGQRLAVSPTTEGRKPINDRNERALQTDEVLHVATVTPSKLDDPAKLVQQLSEVTGFPQDRLLRQVLSSPPNDPVSLVTFGRGRYSQIESKLRALAPQGLRIERVTQPVAPASPVQIVGRVSAVTAETVQQLGGPQRAGDSVGQGGLQQYYQDMLTGSTGTRVITVDLKTNEQVAELHKAQGRVNSSVSTTLDTGVQAAADAAVSVGAQPAALVAVHAPTSEILAVGTKGMNQAKDALAGKFPAGTAFSMVAVDSLVKAGIDAKQKLPCPTERSVGGAQFQQVGAAGGAPTLQSNFANACVTALASLARRVDAKALSDSAAAFGIGATWQLPLKSFPGAMPKVNSDAAKAKVIAGQNVEVSPLSMALVAGAAASGTWKPPVLVTKPTAPPPGAAATPAPVPASEPIQLDAKSLETIKSFMRAGVTRGTAQAAEVQGGQRVHGIAAPALGTRGNNRTKFAWFIGWRGDLAVAVLLQGGEPGDAAAVAGRFFQNAKAPS